MNCHFYPNIISPEIKNDSLDKKSIDIIKKRLAPYEDTYQWIKQNFNQELEKLINACPQVEEDINNYKTWNSDILLEDTSGLYQQVTE